MRVVGVYGSRRSGREHVLVCLSVNGTELNERVVRQEYDGTVIYASNPAYRGSEHWWVVSIDVPNGAVLRLETKVGVFKKGQDTDRTVTHYYEVDDETHVIEVTVSRVGPKKYPLLKGRLKRISQSTKQDAIDQQVAGLYSDVDDDTPRDSE